MAESRRSGAGRHLGGVLERTPQPRPEPATEVEIEASPAEATTKGRGGVQAPKVSRAPAAWTVNRIKGRTVYLPDDLFERIIVQAHRKGQTISDYVTWRLDRHVPDHRVVRSSQATAPATEAGDDLETA